MKLAIPYWNDWISPVLDEAYHFRVIELREDDIADDRAYDLSGKSKFERVQYLRSLGVEMILCGAVSNGYMQVILLSGIRVIPWLRGRIDTILGVFINGELSTGYLMPGCKRRRKRRRIGKHFRERNLR